MFHKRTPLQPEFTKLRLGEVVDCLSKNNLVFHVTIPQTATDPWKIIDRALHEHLATHGIELRRRPGDVGEEFLCLAWDVMAPLKAKKGVITFQMGTAGPKSFTTDFLRQQILQVELQHEATTLPFILFGLSLY